MPFDRSSKDTIIAVFGQSFNTQNLNDGNFYPIQGGDNNGGGVELNQVYAVVNGGILRKIAVTITGNTLASDGSWILRIAGVSEEIITIPAGVDGTFEKITDRIVPNKSQINWQFLANGIGAGQLVSASLIVEFDKLE